MEFVLFFMSRRKYVLFHERTYGKKLYKLKESESLGPLSKIVFEYIGVFIKKVIRIIILHESLGLIQIIGLPKSIS